MNMNSDTFKFNDFEIGFGTNSNRNELSFLTRISSIYEKDYFMDMNVFD